MEECKVGRKGVSVNVDLIIILKSSDQPFWRRTLELPLPDLPVPADMLVYTVEEWQSLAGKKARFYMTVQQEAKWAYDRAEFETG